MQPGGGQPVAPSAVPHGGVAYTEAGWIPNTPSRALTIPEIADLVESFRTAAIRGKQAGFDGVELHAANGYLFDQFLQDGSNKRTDIYGGSFENRARFLIEATQAVISVWGSEPRGRAPRARAAPGATCPTATRKACSLTWRRNWPS